MGYIDYLYLLLIVVFVIIGVLNIWSYANKRRNESIRDYFEGKEQRMNQFKQKIER